MTSVVQLDLFPDLLDQNDLMRWNADYERKGFAVWSVGDDSFSRHEGVSELRSVSVIYDAKEGFSKVKLGKPWAVEFKHHYYIHDIETKGWGSSRTVKPKLKYRGHINERKFKTRDEAIGFAEKLLAVMERVRSQREAKRHVDKYGFSGLLEEDEHEDRNRDNCRRAFTANWRRMPISAARRRLLPKRGTSNCCLGVCVTCEGSEV